MNVTGVWLRREGNDTVVLVEIEGTFVEIIREPHDGNFSHICEEAGMRARAEGTESTVATEAES